MTLKNKLAFLTVLGFSVGAAMGLGCGDNGGKGNGDGNPAPKISEFYTPQEAVTGEEITAQATITDDGYVATATLYHKLKGNDTWIADSMEGTGNSYSVTIPSPTDGAILESKVVAVDDLNKAGESEIRETNVYLSETDASDVINGVFSTDGLGQLANIAENGADYINSTWIGYDLRARWKDILYDGNPVSTLDAYINYVGLDDDEGNALKDEDDLILWGIPNLYVYKIVEAEERPVAKSDLETAVQNFLNGLDGDVNYPPVADAGNIISVPKNTTFVVDATNSYDLDGEILLYELDLEGDGDYEVSNTTGLFNIIGGYPLDTCLYATIRVTDDDNDNDTDIDCIPVGSGTCPNPCP